MTQTVILLHGLARTKRSMHSIEKELTQAGYHVVNIGYPSQAHKITDLAREIAKPMAAALNNLSGPVHVITYSLGALVLNAYLANHTIVGFDKLVLIAPPLKGSPIPDFFKNHRWFQWIFGPAAQELGRKTESPVWHIPATVQMGIIAGKRNWDPLFFLFDGDNDGRVAVSDTKHSNMADHVVLPLTHFQMNYSPEVLTQMKYFLEQGKFQHTNNQ